MDLIVRNPLGGPRQMDTADDPKMVLEGSHSTAVGDVAACRFKVCINPAVTEGLAPDELEALQREFAGWFPGPDLLEAGTEVTGYRDIKGIVKDSKFNSKQGPGPLSFFSFRLPCRALPYLSHYF